MPPTGKRTTSSSRAQRAGYGFVDPYPSILAATLGSRPYHMWDLPQPCLVIPPSFHSMVAPHPLYSALPSSLGLGGGWNSGVSPFLLPALNPLASAVPRPSVSPASLVMSIAGSVPARRRRRPLPDPQISASEDTIALDEEEESRKQEEQQDEPSGTSWTEEEDNYQEEEEEEHNDPPVVAAKPSAGSSSTLQKTATSSKPHSRSSKAWDDMFQRLVEYKNSHGGSTLVPTHYKEDPKLGRWVTNQRHRRDPLSEERKERLNSIGFVWRVKQQESWEVMYERLIDYKLKHGNCLVPQKYKEDPRLGEWVQTQRRERTRCGHHVFADRRAKLDAIGFEWCPHQHVWDQMFQKLLDYRAKYGDCLVPRHHKDDPKLGRWVDQQRVRNKKLGLQPDRKEQLDSIGFTWTRM